MRESKAHRGLRQFVVMTAMVVGTGIGAGTLSGCRVNEQDVERWGTTLHGPDKLVAVVTHDKYEVDLRQRAALELVQMKPRGGRRIGIGRLAEALGPLPSEERKQVIDGLLPMLLEQMKAMPAPAPDQPGLVDASIPYKDAAFALLTHEPKLIEDEAVRQQMTQALIDWTMADFDHRLTAPGQTYSMEQVMRELGASSVAPLPELIRGEDSKFDRIASLVAEIGDEKSKEAAAQKLVALAKSVASAAWVEKTKPEVEKANQASNLEVTPAQLAAQIAQFQDESLSRVFGAIKRVKSRAAVEYCLGFAADSSQTEKRRATAMAALEGQLDGNQSRDVERVLALASADDTPDPVRELAFVRISELPREKVASKLYELFGSKRWQIRAISAQTVLKMSSPDEIAEFMARLPSGASNGFAVSEPLYYGQALADMKEKDGKSAREAVLPFLESGSTAARLTALGYFYAAGTVADLPLVSKLATDRTPTPKVDADDAKWHCDVPKAPDSHETVMVSTIGEFVRLCVEPQMKTRT